MSTRARLLLDGKPKIENTIGSVMVSLKEEIGPDGHLTGYRTFFRDRQTDYLVIGNALFDLNDNVLHIYNVERSFPRFDPITGAGYWSGESILDDTFVTPSIVMNLLENSDWLDQRISFMLRIRLPDLGINLADLGLPGEEI